ncbi:(2Fe-2S)-binding protein [Motilimonas pumila]|uniref:Bacterioferritin-associated ferredoxin n=1 Tax=Motilimonas pumila TaxID=2303987 RepID=A0A418YE52_9GAMM|nr:(2Fe-2S)-binding protein [Motilimonas pumila]RJG47434.1 (2Fe-2S)-binding protein [Motilimonas pumila]
MYVCLCHGVSDKKIKQLALEEGICDVRGIKQCTALGSQCGKCIKQTKEILNETVPILYQKVS